MPHRKKQTHNMYDELVKETPITNNGIDEINAYENLELSLTSESLIDDIELAAESSVSTECPADDATTIECFHCHEVFTRTADVQRHMLDKHVSRAAKPNIQVFLHETEATMLDTQQKINPSQLRKRKTQTDPSGAEGRAVYTCETCEFSALSPAALTVHRKIHSDPDRSSWYKCHLCDFSAKSYSDLSQHGESNHRLKSGRFLCTCCPKTFENYAKARRHVWQTHVDMNVVCQDCGKKFLRMDRLRKHAASAHSDTPAGHCIRCGKAFRRKDKLKDHEEVCLGSSSCRNNHHKKVATSGNPAEPATTVKKRPGPKCVVSTLAPQPDDAYVRFPFRCDICRVGFKNHSDLLIHAEARHRGQIIPVVLPMVDLSHQMAQEQSSPLSGQQYSCPHCQVSWSTLMEIKLHVALDHPSQKDDNSSFECPFCAPSLGRNYPARDRLVRHLRRQHRQLLTPLLRSNSSTNDQDVASHVEIGQLRPSLLSRKVSSSFNASNLNSSSVNSNITEPMISSSEVSQSSSQFMSPLPAVAFQPVQMVHSAPVLDSATYNQHSDGVCEAASPNFFSCGSLTDLSALSVPDAPYSTGRDHLDAMSPVAVTHNQGCAVHQNSVYDASGLVCFADPLSGLVGQGTDESAAGDPAYILAASPLPLSTSVLAACFDSPLTGPLNSHAYQLLE